MRSRPMCTSLAGGNDPLPRDPLLTGGGTGPFVLFARFLNGRCQQKSPPEQSGGLSACRRSAAGDKAVDQVALIRETLARQPGRAQAASGTLPGRSTPKRLFRGEREGAADFRHLGDGRGDEIAEGVKIVARTDARLVHVERPVDL